MHRLLRANNLSGERRQQRPPNPQPIPRLQATGPNQVWTWDIAKLATKQRGQYLSLYVVIPVCQHKPEPIDFELMCKSGCSGDPQCQSQLPLLTRWLNQTRHLKSEYVVSLRLNTSCRLSNKLMPASTVNSGSYCAVSNFIPVNSSSGAVRWPNMV
jgi:transposase InsO family protein